MSSPRSSPCRAARRSTKAGQLAKQRDSTASQRFFWLCFRMRKHSQKNRWLAVESRCFANCPAFVERLAARQGEDRGDDMDVEAFAHPVDQPTIGSFGAHRFRTSSK